MSFDICRSQDHDVLSPALCMTNKDLIIHECAPRFATQLFLDHLSGYTLHVVRQNQGDDKPMCLSQHCFGWPEHRPGSYCVLTRDSTCELSGNGLQTISNLFRQPNLDVSSLFSGLKLFLAASAGSLPMAMHWYGTECSSFVVLCRCQSARKAENGFEEASSSITFTPFRRLWLKNMLLADPGTMMTMIFPILAFFWTAADVYLTRCSNVSSGCFRPNSWSPDFLLGNGFQFPKCLRWKSWF